MTTKFTLIEYSRRPDDFVLDRLKEVVANGGDTSDYYPVEQCAINGLEESLKYLLSFKDADVNGKSGNALYTAAMKKKYGTVKLLLNDKRTTLLPDEDSLWSLERILTYDKKITELFVKSGKITPTIANKLNATVKNDLFGKKIGKFKDFLDV